VIVNIPPPEVVVNQAPGVAAVAPRPCLFHRLHHQPAAPVLVQPAVAAPAFQAVAVQPAPASFVSATLVPATVAPSAGFVAAPQSMSAGFTAVPAAPSAGFVVPIQVSPGLPAGFSGQGGCQSCGGGSGRNSLTDLMAMKVKAQELESRATAALAAAVRDNLQTHQAALSVLNDGKKGEPPLGGASFSPGAGSNARQLEDLYNRVDRLSKSLEELIRLTK
jgi:hypothetical protein